MTKQEYIYGPMSKELAACMLAEYDKSWYIPYIEDEDCVNEVS